MVEKSIGSSETLPNDLGFDIQRRDRPQDPHGGVLIAARRDLQLRNIHCSETIQLISGTVTVEGNKTICIASCYRPPNRTDEAYIDMTRQEIDLLMGKMRKNIFLIGGDFNHPDFNWETMRAEGTQYPCRISQAFLDIESNNSLEQMVDFSTRKVKHWICSSHLIHLTLRSVNHSHQLATETMTLFFLTQASYSDHLSLSDE